MEKQESVLMHVKSGAVAQEVELLVIVEDILGDVKIGAKLGLILG